MEALEIYGFGSYFTGHQDYKDVDILIVHMNCVPKSCWFAIYCKQLFVSSVPVVDVTILSMHEEQQISFIEKSGAMYMGEVSQIFTEISVSVVMRRISMARYQALTNKT